MTLLRQQLTQAKQAYADAHYPSDLAADLLPIPLKPRWRPLLATAVAVSMVAATVAIVLFNNPFARPPSDSMPIEERVELLDLQLPSMPSMPSGITIVPQEDLPIVPEYQALTLPGMPSFPSMDAGPQQQDTPTTQESV